MLTCLQNTKRYKTLKHIVEQYKKHPLDCLEYTVDSTNVLVANLKPLYWALWPCW